MIVLDLQQVHYQILWKEFTEINVILFSFKCESVNEILINYKCLVTKIIQKKIDENPFKRTVKFYINQFSLLLRKCIYLYEFMDDWEKFITRKRRIFMVT